MTTLNDIQVKAVAINNQSISQLLSVKPEFIGISEEMVRQQIISLQELLKLQQHLTE